MTDPGGGKDRPDLLFIDDELLVENENFTNILLQFNCWLLRPPKLAVPLLSAYAKEAGHTVRTVSFPFLPWRENELDDLLYNKPPIVAITTVAIFSPKHVKLIVDRVRELSPDSLIVLGGHGAQYYPGIKEQADVYISGHGEQVLADFVTAFKKGTPPEKFPGATVRNGVIEIPGACRYEGVRKILRPDWDAASTACRRYPLEASRGCAYNCAYCGFPGKAGQTYREPGDVFDEMAQLLRDRGISRFEFMDASFTANADTVSRICALIRGSGLKLSWECFARPDAFDRAPGLANEMAASGCKNVFMGIESIHGHILNLMRRGMDRDCLERGLAAAFKAGIKVHGNFIIGFPGETAETVNDTIRFVAERPFYSAHLCVFMMSEEMRAIAAADSEKYLHLSGTPMTGWKHDTMDYVEASRLARRASWKINLARLWPVAWAITGDRTPSEPRH